MVQSLQSQKANRMPLLRVKLYITVTANSWDCCCSTPFRNDFQPHYVACFAQFWLQPRSHVHGPWGGVCLVSSTGLAGVWQCGSAFFSKCRHFVETSEVETVANTQIGMTVQWLCPMTNSVFLQKFPENFPGGNPIP